MKTKKRTNLDDTKLSPMPTHSRRLICLAVLTVISCACFTAYPATQTDSTKEYQVKAAFLYNFIKFVDWQDEKVANSTGPIVITVIGKGPFGEAFKTIEGKQIKGNIVVIERIESFKQLKKTGVKSESYAKTIKNLRKCQLLFISSSEKKDLEEIFDVLKGSSVLTVGEMDNFLETGGIINFLIKDRKVGFEVNNVAADNANLKIRSKLLRLAKRVIDGSTTDTKTTKTVK